MRCNVVADAARGCTDRCKNCYLPMGTANSIHGTGGDLFLQRCVQGIAGYALARRRGHALRLAYTRLVPMVAAVRHPLLVICGYDVFCPCVGVAIPAAGDD